MNKVRMLRNLLGVQKQGKAQRARRDGVPFADAEVHQNTGVIVYVGEELIGTYKEGQRVIIGNNREEVRINGTDIMVMEAKNVYAIVEETDGGQTLEEVTPAEA